MKRLAIVFAYSMLCGTARADGVLWGQYNGILVFYPLNACTAVPTGTRGICFDSPSGEIKVVTDTGALVAIEGGAGGSAHVIEDEGTPLTARANLNFAGAGVVCTDAAPDTLCTIAGGGGSTPTGTGFRHVVAGVEDAAAKLVDTADVNDAQITYAKIQDVSAASRLLGRGSAAGAGDVEQITLGTNLTMTGTTLDAASGAPKTAQYWVATADADLTAERNLGLLTTGLVLNTVTAAVGVPSTYAGHSCAASNWLRVLDASGAGTCSQPLFSDISGSVTDAQVPNTVTVDLAAAATALAADPANCGVGTEFAVGVTAAGVATCEAIADADVPNTITVDLATLATTATTANFGDSATAFFSLGLLEVPRGGTGSAPASDDQVLVSDSTVAATWRSVPGCTIATQKLIYNTASNTWTCETDAGGAHNLLSATHTDTTPDTPVAGDLVWGKAGGLWQRLPRGTASQQLRTNGAGTDIEWFTPSAGAANSVTTSIAVTSVGMYFSASVAAAWVAAGSAITCKPYGGGASTPTPETIVVSGIEAITASISAGVGFDLMVRNPYGLEGTIEFRCVGV